jgi:selenium metabolism protein YedF
MKEKILVDVRGRPCPQPVIQSRQAMQKKDCVEVLVSQKDQVDNVIRMATRSGWTHEIRQEEDYFRILLLQGETSSETEIRPEDLVCATTTMSGIPRTPTIVISSEFMGHGDDNLGRILMKAYLNTLWETAVKPRRVVLFNSGVKLAVSGSPSIKSLKQLEKDGVDILVCGTCLEFYRIKNDLAVGYVSNMFDIAETMLDTGTVYIS